MEKQFQNSRVTWQHVAHATLGGSKSKLDRIDLNSLYNIIILLLKKLNCEQEKVAIIGVPSRALNDLFQTSHSMTHNLIDDNVAIATDRFDKLPELEARIRRMEYDVRFHLSPEDTLVLEDAEPISHCKLLKNLLFRNSLHMMLSRPLEKVLNGIADKMDLFESEFRFWQEGVVKSHIKQLDDYISTLEHLFSKVESNYAAFRETLLEIQLLLEQKFDKSKITCVKEEIFNTFKLADELLESVLDGHRRHRSVAFVQSNDPSPRPLKESTTSTPYFFNFLNYKCPCTFEHSSTSIPMEITLMHRIEKRLHEAKFEQNKLRLTSAQRSVSKEASGITSLRKHVSVIP